MTTKIQSSNLGPNLIFPGLPSLGGTLLYTDNSLNLATTSYVQTVLTNYTSNIFLNQVKVGNTAASIGSITLQVGTGSLSGYTEFMSWAGTRQGYIGQSATNSTADTGTLNYVAGNHSFTGSIVASGNITAYSDMRLKSNIATITSSLDKVSKLRGVSFDMYGKRNIGVIAQEVENIIPEVIFTDNNSLNYKSVAYGNLIGLLIEAIKELKAQVDVLKGVK
jgi:hypothetical protein